MLRCFPCYVTTDTNHNLSLLSTPNCQAYFKNNPKSLRPSKAFLDLVVKLSGQPLNNSPSDYLYCGTTFTSHFCTTFAAYFCTDLVSRADRSRARALACCSRVHPRAAAVVADDKIVESEVAPRFTPVAAARRSRPYPRAHPLLRIGDPSPYAPSPALPSVDPTSPAVLPTVFLQA